MPEKEITGKLGAVFPSRVALVRVPVRPPAAVVVADKCIACESVI